MFDHQRKDVMRVYSFNLRKTLCNYPSILSCRFHTRYPRFSSKNPSTTNNLLSLWFVNQSPSLVFHQRRHFFLHSSQPQSFFLTLTSFFKSGRFITLKLISNTEGICNKIGLNISNRSLYLSSAPVLG